MSKSKYSKYVFENVNDGEAGLGVTFPAYEGKVLNPILWDGWSNNCPESKIFAELEMSIKGGVVRAAGRKENAGIATKAGNLAIGIAKKPGDVAFVEGPHRHTVDEAFFIFGTNPKDPRSLGGEYEMWLGAGEDAERYRFTKNTCVYVPAGIYHNPQWAVRVDDPDHPIALFAVMLAPKHSDDISEYPRDEAGELLLPPGFEKPWEGWRVARDATGQMKT